MDMVLIIASNVFADEFYFTHPHRGWKSKGWWRRGGRHLPLEGGRTSLLEDNEGEVFARRERSGWLG